MEKIKIKRPHYLSLLVCGFICSFVASSTLAEATEKQIEKQQNQYRITYGSTSWNTDSKNVDQTYLFVRDKKTGKIAKILIEETEPDSSVFSGPFSLDWKTKTSSDIEAFIIDENLRKNQKQLSQVAQQIQAGKLKSSPLFLREQNGLKIVDVYDTPEQAKQARELFEKQKIEEKKIERSSKLKTIPNSQTVSAAQMAEKENLLKKLAREATERENERLRLEQLESQKMALLKKQQDELSKQERQKRINEAQSWAQKGIAAYQKSDFKTAEVAFSKSLELDPSSRTHHFMYGVSLYRNEKMNDALVAFKLSPVNTETELEKSYYMGLIHYRLKEFRAAQDRFLGVQKSNDKVLAPSAAFYSGLVYLSAEDFDKSKSQFEWVIDNSQDPALDKKAEEYIEKIAALIEQKKIAAQKWNIKANIGLSYDSNVLFSPDNESSQGSTTDKGGLRYSLGGDVDYRIFYKAESELNAKLNTSYTYSADSEFAIADPFLVSGSLPYVRKGVFKSKGYKLQLSPGYEVIYMDANDTGTRDNILNTIIANSDVTLIMRDNWYAGYTFEARQEDSLLESAADDNLDATKLSLKTQQTFLLDDSKKRALVALGGLTHANAEGKNKKFNRLDFGAIYAAPTKKWENTSFTFGLTGYYLDYFDATVAREDKNFTLLTSLSRVLKKNWTAGLNASYSNNASSVDDYQYSKYILGTTLTYNWVK